MQWKNRKALTFDIVGTLIDYRAGALSCLRQLLVARKRHLADADVLQRFLRFERETHGANPRMTFTETLPLIWRALCETLGLRSTGADEAALVGSIRSWPPFGDAVSTLALLKKRYRLIAVTNADNWAAEVMGARVGTPFDSVRFCCVWRPPG